MTDRRRWVYFSPSWQELVELEDRTPETTGGPSVDRTTQQFWGLRNVNDAILRRCDTNADGEWDGGDEEAGSGGGTYYQLTDSLFSVIAHVRSRSGDVLCRFSYAVCSGAERTNTGSERVGRARPSILTSGSSCFARSSRPPPTSTATAWLIAGTSTR